MEIVRPTHTAIIVVDMQNDFCSKKGIMSKIGKDVSLVEKMIPNLIDFLKDARKHNLLIIYTKNLESDAVFSHAMINKYHNAREVTWEDTWGAEWFEEYRELLPKENDHVIIKHRYSAFVDTDLDCILRSRQIRTLIMTGVATNVCVESTARDGFIKDYNIVLLEDCTATYSEFAHRATLMSIDEYFGLVKKSKDVEEVWRISKEH